uniref:Protein phosphatase 4 regulatory subunit 3B n=1 Tax=Nomascus leucogenys TaxID=61853 RepID=A0A2I3G8W0_NOMLE
MSDTRRRVKVYTLNEDRQWDDRGTGHVSSTYVEELKGMSLLVRAESDGSLLLESKINPNTAYQKQQFQTESFCTGDNYHFWIKPLSVYSKMYLLVLFNCS